MSKATLTHVLSHCRGVALGAGLLLPLSAFAASGYPGYWTNGAGVLVRSGNGYCVHTGNWTSADAIAACDPDLMPKPKPAPVAAPKPVPAPAPAPMAPPPPPPAPKIITLNEQAAGKAHLGFNKYEITPAQSHLLDMQFQHIDPKTVKNVTVTGYTDRIGSKAYNMKLSEKRAQSVAGYIEQHYMIPASKMTVTGKGPADPVVSCKGVKGKAALIKCLAPNRRVTVAISWTRQVTQPVAPQQ